MINDTNTKEKICAFYASDYHFEIVSLPYIDQKLENKNEIIILSENDLEKTIKNLLEIIKKEDSNESKKYKEKYTKHKLEKR